MRHSRFVWLIVCVAVMLSGVHAAGQTQPEGQLIIAFDTTIAPTYLDPAETSGIATPFVFLYAIHDALIKPLPGNDMAPCLAESWTESPDGLVYEFKLREGLTFHNGDPFTAEDVKFSFFRYKGTSANLLHEKVKAVEVIDTHRLRFVLYAPWPDFLTFYAGTATGASWVVPKTYVEQVGDVITLVNLLALVNQQLQENVSGKKRLQERHGLAAVFVNRPVARQRDAKPFALAVLGKFLFAARPCVRHIPEQRVGRRHLILLITRKARRAEQAANAIR